MTQTGLKVAEQWQIPATWHHEEILEYCSSLNSMLPNALSQIINPWILKWMLSTIPNVDILFFALICRCAKLFLVIFHYKKCLTDHFKQPIWCLWVFISINLFQQIILIWKTGPSSMAFCFKKKKTTTKNPALIFLKAVYIRFWHLHERF